MFITRKIKISGTTLVIPNNSLCYVWLISDITGVITGACVLQDSWIVTGIINYGFIFVPFQIELQPKDIDLERVVTDDISVEPENQSDVEEVIMLLVMLLKTKACL